MAPSSNVTNVNGFCNVLRVITDVFTTIFVTIMFVVELIAGTLFSALSFFIQVILAIPILGRLINQVLCIVQLVIWRVFGALDMLAFAFAIRPEKKLRVHVVLFDPGTGSTGTTTAAMETAVLAQIQAIIDVFRDDANIRVVPVNPIVYRTPFHNDSPADDKYIAKTDGTKWDTSKIKCGCAAWGQDFWTIGFHFNMLAASRVFFGNLRRVLGYGSPITVFVVADIPGNVIGCSLGPLTDYITVDATAISSSTTLAHEVGHACGLLHWDDTNNLMYKYVGPATNSLNKLQAAWVRNSRHVTYW